MCVFAALLQVPTFVSTQEITQLNWYNCAHVAFSYGGEDLE